MKVRAGGSLDEAENETGAESDNRRLSNQPPRDRDIGLEIGTAVHNVIESRFRFKDGLIVEHTDFCDPRAWARHPGIPRWLHPSDA